MVEDMKNQEFPGSVNDIEPTAAEQIASEEQIAAQATEEAAQAVEGAAQAEETIAQAAEEIAQAEIEVPVEAITGTPGPTEQVEAPELESVPAPEVVDVASEIAEPELAAAPTTPATPTLNAESTRTAAAPAKSPKKTTIGGQALIEGIMMCGPHRTAIAVRKADGSIYVEEIKKSAGDVAN